MTDELVEKCARAIGAEIQALWADDNAPLGCAGGYQRIARAVLAIAIPAIREEEARKCDAIADNPPSNDARHIDWQSGFQDGAMEAAAAIRARRTA